MISFLLGELHGETEIPALLRDLWPQLWRVGYRHVAAEISPWAAERLGQRASRDKRPIDGLWTRDQAATVRQFAAPNELVLWGCDIEEGQPESLILNIAALILGTPSFSKWLKSPARDISANRHLNSKTESLKQTFRTVSPKPTSVCGRRAAAGKLIMNNPRIIA
jgi:hypothetical protein